jgi:replicative DNA helicase Mcm
MFAPSIIGYDDVKEGLLLSAVSSSINKKDKKVNTILIGDPGLAKSELLRQVVKLVPNSTFESVQFSTGKSLTAIVSKEEGDLHTLRLGPIPRAKGAIAGLNEIGRMSPTDQGYLLDTMEEQEFTVNKYGLNSRIDSPTVIVGSANPIGGSWKDPEKIDLDEVPAIKPLIDRFDLMFAFRNTRDRDIVTKYADKKFELEDRQPLDDYYRNYLSKHIEYAKRRYVKQTLSDEAKEMLKQYYIEIATKFGSPRVRETIVRISRMIAKLKLKKVVDVQDVKDTIKFYNYILKQHSMYTFL